MRQASQGIGRKPGRMRLMRSSFRVLNKAVASSQIGTRNMAAWRRATHLTRTFPA